MLTAEINDPIDLSALLYFYKILIVFLYKKTLKKNSAVKALLSL